MVSPGEQDNLAHRFVRDNRYTAQKIKKNIYIRPRDQDTEVEPYTNSLYQTPYDTTKNTISTGKLVNTYSGETFETFENQLPAPDTNKGAMLKTQFEHLNPRLLHLTGGYNWHNPPPRKKEQCGSVFNPVSARGGPSPFGSNIYDPQVRKQIELYASRDIYNNKDGDQVVEPSMYGDKPQGYFGLVPRNRIQPFMPATQELSTMGRMSAPQDLNPDLRKREEYTGEFFSRKANLLVSRAVAPNTLINGVEAVAQIPIASDKIGKFGQCQTYITPAFVDGASYVNHEETRPGRITSGQTTRIGPADFPHQPTQQPIDTEFRGKLHPGQSVPISGPSFPSGDLVVSEVKNRPSGKDLAENTLPVVNASLPGAGGMIESEQNIRDTLKIATNEHNRVGGPSIPMAGDVTVSTQTLRPSAKAGMVDAAFQVKGTAREDLGQNVMPSVQNLRPSAKSNMVDVPFPHTVISNEQLQTHLGLPMLQNLRPSMKVALEEQKHTGGVSSGVFGGMVMDHANIRPTIKFNNETFRTVALTPVATGGLIVSEQTIRDTLKHEKALRVNDPSIPTAGGLLTSQATIRDSGKIGLVDQALRVGAANLPNTGEILTSQASIRDTLRINMEKSYPSGAVDVTMPQGWVQLDQNVPCTQRMTTSVLSHQPGPDGSRFGDELPPQLVTSNQHRGVQIQPYITQNKKVIDGIGGNSTRVIGQFRQLRPKADTYFYLNPDQDFVQPKSAKIIPSVRLTQRALTEARDLACVQDMETC